MRIWYRNSSRIGNLAGAVFDFGVAMKTLETVLVLIVLLILLAVLIFALQPLTDARAREVRIQEAITRSHDITWAMRGAFVIAGIAGLIGCGILIEIWRMFRQRVKRVHVGPTGAYPLLEAGKQMIDYNPPNVLAFGALATAKRLGGMGSVVKAMLPSTDVPQLEAPEPPQLPERVSVYNLPKPSALSMAFGESVNGPLIFQLADLDNIIIAGLRGMGKTEYLAAMIAYLLRQDATGQSVKLALMDLKALDFALVPPDLAALWCPVARDPVAALDCIKAMHAEMLTRRTTLSEAHQDHIENYRRTGGVMPYLFGIIDELALMTTGATPDSKDRAAEFVECALEIGRIGRAMGVTLTMATQLASGKNIPIPLRDNCGIQVAFRLPNSDASQSVLALAGAEKLPPIPGRALVRRGGDPIPVQGYYADRGGKFRQFLSEMPRIDTVGRSWLQPTPTNKPESALPAAQPTPTIERGRKPTPEQAAEMRYQYDRGTTKTDICLAYYGYKDGATFHFINQALKGEI